MPNSLSDIDQDPWYFDASVWCKILMLVAVVAIGVVSFVAYQMWFQRVFNLLGLSFIVCLGIAFGIEPIQDFLDWIKAKV